MASRGAGSADGRWFVVAVAGIAAVVASAVLVGRPTDDTSVPVSSRADRATDPQPDERRGVSSGEASKVPRGDGAALFPPREKDGSVDGSTERRSHGDPEDAMEADELLRAAMEAYDSGEPDVAYRRAAKSHAKQPSEAALEIKAKAACEMKNEDAAKAAVRDLPRSRKREVRKACRSAGVWLTVG